MVSPEAKSQGVELQPVVTEAEECTFDPHTASNPGGPEALVEESGGGAKRAPRPPVAEEASGSSLRRVLAACIVGNILEWFDFGVFAFLAPQIGRLFFPKEDPTAGIINSFVIFGGGFVARPLGGVIIADIGDRFGRKQALFLSVAGMAVATCAMGCLPTYRDIGGLAPALLAAMRLLQGLSVGGELVGSMIFAVESMPANRQVLGGAISMAGCIAGLTLGSSAGLVLHAFLTDDEIEQWGWRIPFWTGVLIGLFACWMRSGVEESKEFSQHKKEESQRSFEEAQTDGVEVEKLPCKAPPSRVPILDAFRGKVVDIFICFLGGAVWCSGVWVLVAFPPTLYESLMQPPLSHRISAGAQNFSDAEWQNEAGMEELQLEGPIYQEGSRKVWTMHTLQCALQTCGIFAAGLIGDRIGSSGLMVLGALLAALAAVPCLDAMGSGSFMQAAMGQASLTLCYCCVGASVPAWMVKGFPVEIRYTCLAVGYNASQALFGGTAGVIATLLYHQTGWAGSVGIYLSAVAALSFCSILLSARRLRKRQLEGSLESPSVADGTSA